MILVGLINIPRRPVVVDMEMAHVSSVQFAICVDPKGVFVADGYAAFPEFGFKGRMAQRRVCWQLARVDHGVQWDGLRDAFHVTLNIRATGSQEALPLGIPYHPAAGHFFEARGGGERRDRRHGSATFCIEGVKTAGVGALFFFAFPWEPERV